MLSLKYYLVQYRLLVTFLTITVARVRLDMLNVSIWVRSQELQVTLDSQYLLIYMIANIC